MKSKYLLSEAELSSALEQAIDGFLNHPANKKLKRKCNDYSSEQKVECIMSDDKVIRQFAIFLIVQLGGFIFHSDQIVIRSDGKTDLTENTNQVTDSRFIQHMINSEIN